MVASIILQLGVVLPCLFSIGSAIHCFECNSETNPECRDLTEDNTNSTLYRNCTGGGDNQNLFCRKVFTKNLNTDEERILRSCGWIQKNPATTKEISERKDNCRKIDNGFLQRINCACFTDACNSAVTFRPSVLEVTMTFVSTIVVLILCSK